MKDRLRKEERFSGAVARDPARCVPLGSGMRQNGIGGRESDRVQDDDKIRHHRRDIDAGMQHFLAEGANGGAVDISRQAGCDGAETWVMMLLAEAGSPWIWVWTAKPWTAKATSMNNRNSRDRSGLPVAVCWSKRVMRKKTFKVRNDLCRFSARARNWIFLHGQCTHRASLVG